jgi:hypothetical protein
VEKGLPTEKFASHGSIQQLWWAEGQHVKRPLQIPYTRIQSSTLNRETSAEVAPGLILHLPF